jgi:hypothetical protein
LAFISILFQNEELASFCQIETNLQFQQWIPL